MTKIWDQLAEGIFNIWNVRVLLPAILFWGGGFIAWVRSSHNCLRQVLIMFESIEPSHGIAIGVAVLLLLVISIFIVQSLTLTVLRLSEGYWPKVFKRVHSICIKQIHNEFIKKEKRWEKLENRLDKLTTPKKEEHDLLDNEISFNYPSESLLMPTRIGNILRAAEEYPLLRYGLNISIVWPKLWLVLPESTKREISTARQALDECVQFMIWGILFTAWSIWVLWAFSVGVIVSIATYYCMLSKSSVYGELLRAAFDLHRFELYKSLNWPLPKSPADEKKAGEDLTSYLYRGVEPDGLQFKIT